MKRKEVKRSPKEYPIRGKSLGKNKNAEQGVGGWRSNYYRPPNTNGWYNPVTEGVDIRTSILAEYEQRRTR